MQFRRELWRRLLGAELFKDDMAHETRLSLGDLRSGCHSCSDVREWLRYAGLVGKSSFRFLVIILVV